MNSTVVRSTLFFSLVTGLWAQGLTVSVQQLSLSMPDGGPRSQDAKVTITSNRPWKVTTSDADLVNPSPASGTGNGTFAAIPVLYRKPGVSTGTLTVTDDQNNSRTIAVSLTVVARKVAPITYPRGRVTGCKDVPGLPAGNAALCTVPNENPVGSFKPPAIGGSYLDPNFGGRTRVIGDPRSLHGYSTPSPISAFNRWVLMSTNDETRLVELTTGKVVKKLTSGIEGVMWDSVTENYLYSFSGATIRRLDVNSTQTTVIADYSRAPYQFQSITSGGTGDITKDNWISFAAPRESQVCALDLGATKTYCGAIPTGVVADFVTLSKGVDKGSGLRYVILVPNNGSAFVLYSVNQSANRLDLVGRGPEAVYMEGANNRNGICETGEYCINGGHSDTSQDSAGNQVLMMAVEEQTPCGYSVYSVQLNKGASMGIPTELGGGLKRIMPLFRCGGEDLWADYHLACAKAAPQCALSITMGGFAQVRDPNDTTPVRRTSYLGEIVTIRDNGAEVRRIVQNRALAFKNEEANGYWSTPRAAISNDGAYIVYGSNFGLPNQNRVMLAETADTAPKLAQGNPVLNAASYDANVAPGVLAVAFGSGLALCTQGAAFPLPTDICGTTVKVSGADARLMSVTPDQVAFLMPASTAPRQDATITVQVAADGGVDTTSGTIPASAILSSAPAFFAQATPGLDGINTVRLWNLLGEEQPMGSIHPGDYAIAFAIGLGPTNPAVADGERSPEAEPLARITAPLEVYINDVRQRVLYAGLIPGMSSIYQINLQIDSSTPIKPDYNWIWVNASGVDNPRILITLLPAA